jgi:hypothetical protein
MSRAVFLNMSERAATAHCKAENIGISTMRKLPTGGIRLVCMSVDGAERIRRDLKSLLLKGEVAREQQGPGWGFVARP